MSHDSYEWVMCSYVSHADCTCDVTPLREKNMTPWPVRHESLRCVTWLIKVRDMTVKVCDMTHLPSRPDTAHTQTHTRIRTHTHTYTHTHTAHNLCNVTHSRVRRDSFTWRHDSFTCATWLIHVWSVTPSLVRHVRCSVLQRAAVRCSALQCVAVCCSVLQCVAV